MAVRHASFTLQSDRRPTFHDVTPQVQDALATSGVRDGILLVYSQHTTCSVLVQEASDDVEYWGTELLMQDLVTVLEGFHDPKGVPGKWDALLAVWRAKVSET